LTWYIKPFCGKMGWLKPDQTEKNEGKDVRWSEPGRGTPCSRGPLCCCAEGGCGGCLFPDQLTGILWSPSPAPRSPGGPLLAAAAAEPLRPHRRRPVLLAAVLLALPPHHHPVQQPRAPGGAGRGGRLCGWLSVE